MTDKTAVSLHQCVTFTLLLSKATSARCPAQDTPGGRSDGLCIRSGLFNVCTSTVISRCSTN